MIQFRVALPFKKKKYLTHNYEGTVYKKQKTKVI